MPENMQRVIVVGSGGAGKSTLARALAARLRLPLVHLDAEFWNPGWVPTPKDAWRARVDALVARPAWIIDGNFGGTLEARIAAADTIVWLDFPRLLCLRRAVARQWRYRGRTRPDMAPGCPERLSWEFLQWIWTYPARKRPGIAARLARLRDDQQAVVLRSPADAERWLQSVPVRTG